MANPIPIRIRALRSEMKKYGLDAYLIPSGDPHQSEYVASHWKAREWISGFTGSAGIVVVTQDHAGLWTDSRYFLQAEKELAGCEVKLHRQEVPHAPEHIDWLVDHLPERSVVGCNGLLFSVDQIRYLARKFYPKNIEINTHFDLIEKIWTDRPPLPANEVFEHPLSFTQIDRPEKLQQVVTRLKEKGANFQLVSTLDDIAWALNFRSDDVEFNPVCIAYLIVGDILSYLFVEEKKIPADLHAQMQKEGIVIKPYTEIESFLNDLLSRKRILVDHATTSIRLFNAIPERKRLKEANIIRQLKAIKSAHEISHIRQAMIKDGVALTHLFYWLDAQLKKGTPTEVEVAKKLQHFRQEQEDYYGESFAAIVGYEANGAIIHYRPDPANCATIKKEGILLLDSGGQYFDGTTDITRTVALGKPTAEQKRNFTLVLKGHIALATIRFPEGTSGTQLDTLARMYLWKDGLNYGHGTGHGVGYFLNVHEPPQGFATGNRGREALRAGMLTSNEPGFYKPGAYGIRIENLILCVESKKTDSGPFLEFETLSLFPIDRQLIEPSLLSQEEIDWLNAYHREVFAKLSPFLGKEEVKWLEKACEGIT